MTLVDTALSASLRRRVHDAAREAGRMALAEFRPGAATAAHVRHKSGGSPVSDADIAVDDFLRRVLTQALPEAGWLSEETADDRARIGTGLCWVVDPIDGTRAFITGERSWAVSIALVAEARPIFGIVFAPALDLLYEAAAGEGATLNGEPISVSGGQGSGRMAGSRVAGPKDLIDRLERHAGTLVRLPKVPSLALRLARVAEGEIDLGLVSANAWDWDIAAADLLIHEAGGRLSTLEDAQPVYNLHDPQHDILIAGGAELHRQAMAALTPAGRSKR